LTLWLACRLVPAEVPPPPLPGEHGMQPKVYNRDGKELGELPKGDMYIRDMKNTKGALARQQNVAALCWA